MNICNNSKFCYNHGMNPLNTIIPADDLYWSDVENKYIALSEEEIKIIIQKSVEDGFKEEKEILQILSWATNARVGFLLLKNLLNDKIKIMGIDEDEEPLFTTND